MRAEEQYALDGARAAAGRVARSVYRDELGHAAAEAATWIAALDERLGGKESNSAYVAACQQAGMRELMQGFRYVRNQAIHSLLILPEETGRMVTGFPAPLGGGGPTLIWQGKWAPQGARPAQYAAFQAALAGRGVARTIDDAIGWLSGYVSA